MALPRSNLANLEQTQLPWEPAWLVHSSTQCFFLLRVHTDLFAGHMPALCYDVCGVCTCFLHRDWEFTRNGPQLFSFSYLSHAISHGLGTFLETTNMTNNMAESQWLLE